MDNNGVVVNNVCFLQYYIFFGEDVVNFEVKSYGILKKDKLFFLSEKSFLYIMKERVIKELLRIVYEDVKQKVGGFIKVDNIG